MGDDFQSSVRHTSMLGRDASHADLHWLRLCMLFLTHACVYGRAWRRITAGRDVAHIAVACIGSTTAIAAEKQGFQRVYFPDQPGIEGFVSAITDALSNAHTTRAITNVA